MVGDCMEGSLAGTERVVSATVCGCPMGGALDALGVAGNEGRVELLGPLLRLAGTVGLFKPGVLPKGSGDWVGPVGGGRILDLSKAVCGAGLRGSVGVIPLLAGREPGVFSRLGLASGAVGSAKSAIVF